jgi:hypothetical protein
MIEPIRGELYAYDISCAACGVVERFENLGLAPHILLPKLAAKGWRILAGRHYCREGQTPVLSASREELEGLFGIELVKPVTPASRSAIHRR